MSMSITIAYGSLSAVATYYCVSELLVARWLELQVRHMTVPRVARRYACEAHHARERVLARGALALGLAVVAVLPLLAPC